MDFRVAVTGPRHASSASDATMSESRPRRQPIRPRRGPGVPFPGASVTFEAVKFLAHQELAGEPRSVAHVKGLVEHVLFLRLDRIELAGPVRRHVDMAGGAGAGAAAFGLDVEAPVANDLHNPEAFERFERVAGSGLVR